MVPPHRRRLARHMGTQRRRPPLERPLRPAPQSSRHRPGRACAGKPCQVHRLRNGLEEWEPRFDEHFVEWYGFHNSPSGVFSFSVKAGRVRYLRFPYPDAISTFDQVPGMEDLGGGVDVTGYSGVIATVDYAHRSGLGLHGVWIDWGFGVDRPAEWAARYVFYRRTSHPWHFEARWGDLALRSLPMGKCGEGYSIFVGRDMGGWDAGFLYEDISGQETYTGIVITFKQNNATRWMGSVAFDYTRTPEGFALQLPLLSGTFGNLIRMDASREPAFTGILMAPGKKGFLEAQGLVLVGEIVAERIRTYWQNGQVRNWYEHRLSSWGRTSGKDVVAVMVEDPGTATGGPGQPPYGLLELGRHPGMGTRPHGPSAAVSESHI